MNLHRHMPVIPALAVLLALFAAVMPAVSLAHAIEHLGEEVAADAHAADGHGEEAPESGQCDLCQASSLTRAALVPTQALSQAEVALRSDAERPAPDAVPARCAHAPDAPRAPPLG